jgi:hypothetical protein
MLRRIVLALALLLLPSPAFAWWDYGHQVIARIAWRESTQRTRAEIRRLLSQAHLLETPTCPARTIEQASVWPDCIKQLGDRFSYAFPWHYQNIGICRPFDPAAACPDGNCVTAQIARQTRLLADRRLPPRERLMALSFLVHFVGDLHQPLHAADRGDQGGGRMRASYGFITGINLHLIWDGHLAERSISTPPGGAEGLLSGLGAAERNAMRAGTIADWTRESWEVGREHTYGAVTGDPCALPRSEPMAISEDATRRLIPIVRRQAIRGGLRLARLLDEALNPPL